MIERRLCIFYDDEKMSYVGMTEKADPGDLTGKRKRIVGVRAQELGRLCEYDVYFTEHAAMSICGPCLLKANGTYWLYVQLQQDENSIPRIAFATSADCDAWSALRFTNVEDATAPWANFDPTTGRFTLFFERGGQIWSAESADGIGFGTPTQATNIAGGCGGPSAIRLGTEWHVFYHTGSRIERIRGQSPGNHG